MRSLMLHKVIDKKIKYLYNNFEIRQRSDDYGNKNSRKRITSYRGN